MLTTKPVRHKALDLLARREHSRLELHKKLVLREYPRDDIEACLSELEADNLLSNERFCEAYVRMRSRRGYGPNHVGLALQQRGISDSMAQAHLVLVDWLPFAEQCFVKKFGSHVSADFTERTKQQQFLNYRGYTAEQIKQVFNRLPTGDLGNGV